MSNAERLIEALASTFAEGEMEISEALIERMSAALEPIAADDFVTVMTGPDASFTGTWEGLDGLRAAWADWLDTFSSIRLELEGLEEIGDCVLTLARQTGTTRHGGVELEQPSAALWRFRDDRLVAVEFHLDPERARAAAREPA